MPCIQVTTNKKMTLEDQERMKARFGKAIELLPRKSEKWLMCIFRPESSMWFHGEQPDMAFLEVDVFGTLDQNCCSALTEELMSIVNSELHIASDQIYIKYSETPNWGWAGKNF